MRWKFIAFSNLKNKLKTDRTFLPVSLSYSSFSVDCNLHKLNSILQKIHKLSMINFRLTLRLSGENSKVKRSFFKLTIKGGLNI